MKKIISFSVSEAEIKSLSLLADATGVSLSQIARGFMRESIKSNYLTIDLKNKAQAKKAARNSRLGFVVQLGKGGQSYLSKATAKTTTKTIAAKSQ